METVVESEYQDIYRVTNGVLLIVNKFRRIDYSSQTERCVILYGGKYKSYNKNCQKQLKMLKEDCNIYGITIPKGTIVYHYFPVEIVSDKVDYTIRSDDCTNTITTVQKDNYILCIGAAMRGRYCNKKTQQKSN